MTSGKSISAVPLKSQKFRYNSRTGYHIDMTPYVDLIMLLLTFFILTTVLEKPQLMQINLPKGDGIVNIPMNNMLFIRVSESGVIFVSKGRENGTEEPPVKASLEQMRISLESFGNVNKDMVMMLKFHPKAKYDVMVSVLDEINRASVEQRYSFGKMEKSDLTIIESAGS